MVAFEESTGNDLFLVTGGMGSGKSTVSARLAENGATIVDADAIVKKLQSPGAPLLAVMAEILGEQILEGDSLNRAVAAEIMFGDHEKKQRVERALHAAVYEEMDRQIDSVTPEETAVVDIPLFLGGRTLGRHALTGVVVVDVSTELAIARLVEHRGFTTEQAKVRISQQISREERRSFADRVIQNFAGLEELHRQTDEVWQWMQEKKLLRAIGVLASREVR